MGLSGCNALIKYFVVLVNLLFWFLGLAIVGLAIWMLTDPTFYLSMSQDEANYYIALYLFLAIGVLMVVVAFCGCCGACKESRCMLVSFFCCLFVILIAEVAAGVWAYSNSEELETLVRDSVRTTVQEEYGSVQSRTITYDVFQRELECCGIDGPGDWAASKYNREGKTGISLALSAISPVYKIPQSCCRQGISVEECNVAHQIGLGARISNSIYQQGCIDKIVEAFKQRANLVLIIGFVVAILEILGLVFSCVLTFAIKDSDRYKA